MSFLFRYLRFHDIIGGIHVPVDDGVDKLNRKYTLLVFLFLALPIFTKQYIGDPIECFAPVYFAEHQSRYINSYCWTQSTYYMVPVGDPDDDGDQQEPPDRIAPDELDYFISFETVTHIGNERLRRVRVNYYQWAPLILLAQGLCFYIPFLIWNSCANNAGVKLRRLLKKASDIASLPPGCQQREALLAEFVDQFHTLVMGEAGWCADLQCGGGAGVGPPPPRGNQDGGTSSGGSSASNSSAGSGQGGAGGGGAGAGGGGSAHHHHHQANGATAAVRGGGGTAGRQAGGGANASDDHHRSNSSHHHHPNSSSAGGGGGAGSGAGCCLVSIPILGSLISCCLKPCSSFGLVGPSKYLCLLYLAVKFAYVFNVGLQFFLLGKFLGRGYLRHGLELINRILQSGEWWASPRFPLSTLCQVRADMSGGLRSYTCQCVLPINVFNEKIFSVVWFYMAFLLPLNVLSLLFWIYRTFESNRMSYIRLCLWRTRLVELNQIHRTVRRLSQSYLGWDGVFLLRLIEHNHGSIMATLIMSRLWEFYANQIKLQEDANQIALANNAQHTLANLTNTQAAITNHQHQHPAQHHQHQHQHGPQQQQHAHHPQQPQQQHQYLTNQPHSHQQSHQHQHHHQPPPPPSQHPHAHHHHPVANAVAGGGGHHHHPIVAPGAGPGGGHHNHAHAHSMHAFAGSHGPPPPLQPTQAGPGNFGAGGPHPAPPPPPMVAHGPASTGQHGHHSGQVSQAPGHHPLHAANTAAATAHHVHHAAMAAAVAAATNSTSATSAGPTLSGAFTGAHANLLAQLHHQATSNQQQQQQQQQQSNQQQQPPGNVAAAVAALAAAAAAATSNQPGANNNNGNSNNSGGGGNSALVAASGGPANQTSASAAAIHLQSLKQQQAAAAAAAAASASSSASQQQQGGASAGSGGQQQQAGAAGANGSSSSSSATTSFITAGASSGPPLPPPPPAHVVAAVAAASGTTPAGLPAARTGVGGPTQPSSGPGAASGRPPVSAASTAPAPTSSAAAAGSGTGSGAQSAPVPPPHTSTNLFNLKSSSIQAAAAAAATGLPAVNGVGAVAGGGNLGAQQGQATSRFASSHSTIKRT